MQIQYKLDISQDLNWSHRVTKSNFTFHVYWKNATHTLKTFGVDTQVFFNV